MTLVADELRGKTVEELRKLVSKLVLDADPEAFECAEEIVAFLEAHSLT